jgi:ABC-type transport system involved in cytochrome c biogenesis permease component
MLKLLWKEWHEQSWKLGFGCVLLAAFVLIGLHARIVADETILTGVCVLGFTLLPVLSSTGLIPAERAEGSFESLLAMPIAPWKILLAKSVMGVLLCIGPMLVACGFSCLMAGGREMFTYDILHLYAQTTFASVLLLFWMMALTSRLPSEARAGLVAVGILICWFLGTAGLGYPHHPNQLVGISPLALIHFWFSNPDREISLPVVLGLQAIIVAVLWYSTLKLFVGSSGRESS